jgi:hypothetical protein
MRRQSQREFKMMALSSLLLQIYSTTVLLAVTSMNIWLIIGRNVVFYRKISFTNAIIDTLGAILVAAISILNCLFEDFFLSAEGVSSSHLSKRNCKLPSFRQSQQQTKNSQASNLFRIFCHIHLSPLCQLLRFWFCLFQVRRNDTLPNE